MFTSFSSFSSMQNNMIIPPSGGYEIISDTTYDYYVFKGTIGRINYTVMPNTTIYMLAVASGNNGYNGSGTSPNKTNGGAGGNVVCATSILSGTNNIQVNVGIVGLPSIIKFSDTTITGSTITNGTLNGTITGGTITASVNTSTGSSNTTTPSGFYPINLPLFNTFKYGAFGGKGNTALYLGAKGGTHGGGGGGWGQNGSGGVAAGNNGSGGIGATNGPSSINKGSDGSGQNGGAAGANTGGGGGGGGVPNGAGGAGGSGIVVIAFPINSITIN
jgi:hypothetical protein